VTVRPPTGGFRGGAWVMLCLCIDGRFPSRLVGAAGGVTRTPRAGSCTCFFSRLEKLGWRGQALCRGRGVASCCYVGRVGDRKHASASEGRRRPWDRGRLRAATTGRSSGGRPLGRDGLPSITSRPMRWQNRLSATWTTSPASRQRQGGLRTLTCLSFGGRRMTPGRGRER